MRTNTFINGDSKMNRTSVQSNLITDLSYLAAANELIQSWLPSNRLFLGFTWVNYQTASRSVQPFL